jgi:hypothetical protein
MWSGVHKSRGGTCSGNFDRTAPHHRAWPRDLQPTAGAKYDMAEDSEGPWGDAWYYEGRPIYVHKRHVAIADAAVSRGPNGISSWTAPNR